MLIELFPSREVFVAAGAFEVRWYGLLWVAAFAVAAYLLPRLSRHRDVKLSRVDWWYISAWAAAGAIFGGRLGYVFLWEPTYFFVRPADILAVWEGGLAAHGGLIGVGLGLLWATRRLKIDYFKLLDIVAVPAAFGLALGRVGNFINQELFDPPELAWLAVAKNIAIALITYLVLIKNKQPGTAVATFLVSYGVLRFFIEFVRVQEFSGAWGLSRGQLFTLPVISAGVLLWIWQRRKLGHGNTEGE